MAPGLICEGYWQVYSQRSIFRIADPTYGISYSQVCGRLRGYQVGTTGAFSPYGKNLDVVIDDILISHGKAQEHIWAYATARKKPNVTANARKRICPCHPEFNGQVPPFIGNDYYCDSGVENDSVALGQFYSTPLWTAEGCAPPDCCFPSKIPWFCKTLPVPTTDYIEIRNCHSGPASNEDTALDLIELYIH